MTRPFSFFKVIHECLSYAVVKVGKDRDPGIQHQALIN